MRPSLGSQSRALLSRHISHTPGARFQRHPYSDRPFKPDDLVLLRNKNDRAAPPILTRPLKPGRRIESHRGIVLHDDIIGRQARDVVKAQTPRSIRGAVGAEYRLHHVSLDDYCRLSRRLVTPIYPADAKLIVSLLDLHPPSPQDESEAPMQILEAGTGHGALTLYLSQAIRSINATLHTIEVSSKLSAHAQEIVKGFRGGIYAENVHFHVGDVGQWVSKEQSSQADPTSPFLAHALLDLPKADSQLSTVASALKTDGILIVFNPSITQIIECATKVKDEHIQLDLETVIELGVNGSTGGRDWDVRFVRPRATLKKDRTVDVNEDQTLNNSPTDAGNGVLDAPESATAGEAVDAEKWSLVCRPKVGERIVGGGFLGVWRKHRDMR